MTRLPALWAILTGRNPFNDPTPRQVCLAAYDDARRRNDTRDKHKTLEALRAATIAELMG